MEKKVLKSFNCMMMSAQLTLVTFKSCDSRQQVYEVSWWTLIKDSTLASNYNVSTFGDDEHSAKDCFRDLVSHWI